MILAKTFYLSAYYWTCYLLSIDFNLTACYFFLIKAFACLGVILPGSNTVKHILLQHKCNKIKSWFWSTILSWSVSLHLWPILLSLYKMSFAVSVPGSHILADAAAADWLIEGRKLKLNFKKFKRETFLCQLFWTNFCQKNQFSVYERNRFVGGGGDQCDQICAKLCHYGRILIVFGIVRVRSVLGKMLNLLWQNFKLLWKFSCLQKAKYWQKYLSIWSHWWWSETQTGRNKICPNFDAPVVDVIKLFLEEI